MPFPLWVSDIGSDTTLILVLEAHRDIILLVGFLSRLSAGGLAVHHTGGGMLAVFLVSALLLL